MRYATYIVSFLLTLVLISAFTAGAVGLAYVREQTALLPDLEPLLDYKPAVHSSVFDADGEEVFSFGRERRDPAKLSEIPQVLIDAFIAAEDKNFWTHPGFDTLAILRAAAGNMTSGSVQSGASTITQQLVKNVILSPEQSLERKAQEALAAAKLEKLLTKEELLERYLNEIYLGRGAYGVRIAAATYFDKALSDLTLGEAAFIAGLPKAPSRYASNAEAGEKRRAYVLDRMLADGFISEADHHTALASPLAFDEKAATFLKQSHYLQAALPEIKSLMADDTSLSAAGLQIHLAQDSEIQSIVERSLQNGLLAYDRRKGTWRGAVEEGATPALPSWRTGLLIQKAGQYGVSFGLQSYPLSKASIEWAQRSPAALEPGSWVMVELLDGYAELRQEPKVQGGVVAMDPKTGRVLGLSGAFKEGDSFFNRAIMAERQPGSSLKPFTYAAALQSGWAPNSPILDGTMAIDAGAGQDVWRPRDHGYSENGFVTLRSGLEHSRNTVTLRLFDALGAETVASTLEALGVYEKAPRHASMALGAVEAKLINVVAGYASLASDGRPVVPTFIYHILTEAGTDLESLNAEASEDAATDAQRPVFDEVTLAQVRSMLRGVVERGTAWRAFEGAGYELQGKTGTSNGAKDTWFIGFTRNLVVGAYVGFDTPAPLGSYETGGKTAAPIVREVFDKVDPAFRANDYPFPEGAYIETIDRDTGVPGEGSFPEILRRSQ